MPIGNDLLGLLLFDPNTEIAAAASYAFGRIKLLKDNVEQYLPESNWESLRDAVGRRAAALLAATGHRHVRQPVTALEAAGAEQQTDEQIFNLNEMPLQYGYLDFDPLRDGSYALETRGAGSLDLDINADVAGDAVVRVTPVELVPVGGAAPRA